MGRLDVNTSITLDADDDILDVLEDIDTPLIIDIDMDAQLGDVRPDIRSRNKSCKDTRRRLEDKLEDLRLKRQITDYNFNLH
jgi:hypothetical protein